MAAYCPAPLSISCGSSRFGTLMPLERSWIERSRTVWSRLNVAPVWRVSPDVVEARPGVNPQTDRNHHQYGDYDHNVLSMLLHAMTPMTLRTRHAGRRRA